MGQHKRSTEGKIDLGKSHQNLPVFSVAFGIAGASEHQDYKKALFALGSFASGAIRGGCFPSLEPRSPAAARRGIANEGYAKVTREKHHP